MHRSFVKKALPSLSALLAIAIPPAFGIDVPPAPQVQPPEATGEVTAAYWVIAYDDQYRATSVSEPTIVNNLPAQLTEDDPVRIDIQPVDGAQRYEVLKTEAMRPVQNVKVEAASDGDDTYYYWVRWRNSFRLSQMAGPVKVTCGDPAGNVISWDRPANATYYEVYRTETPEPPVGRKKHAVAWLYWPGKGGYNWWLKWRQPDHVTFTPGGRHEVTEADRLSVATTGQPATPVDQPIVGMGLYSVGEASAAGVIEDTGQPLLSSGAPHINATDRAPITGPAAGQGDILAKGGAQYLTQTTQNPPNLGRFSYGGAHLESFMIHNTVEQGGHSEREGGRPNGDNGPKAYINGITSKVFSHTSAQHSALSTHLAVMGSGDGLVTGNTLDYYGSNNDGGDEGASLQRNHLRRILSGWDATLQSDAPRGSIHLDVGKIDYRYGGSERVLINKTQAHTDGRIKRVDNVEIYGKNTNWTPDMEGRYISFDVDTVMPDRGRHRAKEPHRMWYWVTDVHGPEHLTIRAQTGWSTTTNMGYSNFIWDPETDDGPNPPGGHSMAIKQLPEEKEAAAREGGYQLAPGVKLGDPWKRDDSTLHTEPIMTDWNKGDRVRITAGPQASVHMGRWVIRGELLPQDVAYGLAFGNWAGRMTNGPAIKIGAPTSKNFRSGVEINVNPDGHGDGIVVKAATGWGEDGNPAGNAGVDRGAVVVPNNLAGVVGKNNWRYPHLGWAFDNDSDAPLSDAMVIARHDGKRLASFTDRGLRSTFHGDVKLDSELIGNDKTRGKREFEPDGQTTRFTIDFGGHMRHGEPVVTYSTNRFETSRLAEVTATGFTIEFQQAPADDQPIVVRWLAQQ